MNSVERALAQYVDTLDRKGVFLSRPVRRAFRRVRRHRFLTSWYRPEVDEDLRASFACIQYDRDNPTEDELSEIYSDQALITKISGPFPSSSTSQPHLIAGMLEHLKLEPGMRVLEIGTGTGYNTALLAEILGTTGKVSSVELQRDVAERAEHSLAAEGYTDIRVLCGDGFAGVTEDAPFDRIIATVGCSDISPHWIDQLSPEGVLLVPLQHGFSDPLVAIHRDPDALDCAVGQIVGHSTFMPIQGEMEWINPWQSAIARVPQPPVWTRPLPEILRASHNCVSVPGNLRHQGLPFFLALASKDLWFVPHGYGLADQGTGSTIVVTADSIEGYSPHSQGDGLEVLSSRLQLLLELWEQLGCKEPQDYHLRFVPRLQLPTPGDDESNTWIIERPLHWELVTIPERDPTPKRMA